MITYLEDVHFDRLDDEGKDVIVQLSGICVGEGCRLSNQLQREPFHFILYEQNEREHHQHHHRLVQMPKVAFAVYKLKALNSS
jgi:hypothetical protein